MKALPMKLKVYLVSIYLITIISLYLSINSGHVMFKSINYFDLIFFVILITLTESFTFYFKKMSFSTSFAVQLASYILFGVFPTLLFILFGFSLRVLKANGQYKHIFNTPIYGTVFNYCTLILPIVYGDYFYIILGGKVPVINIESNLISIIVFSFVAFIVNTFIISSLYSILSNKNLMFVFIGNVRLGVLNIIAMAPFGVILAIIFKNYNYLGVLLFIFPIILSKYTFSLYIEAKTKYRQTVDVIMNAMEARDKYTQGHSKRVGELAEIIARELKYNEWKIEQLTMAAILHDVGKIGIDDSILNKQDKLTDEEYDMIKQHPQIGYNILKDIKDIENINYIVKHHHERYDGKGYPDGKSAKELSLDVFIIQLADSIDAMATDRPYRKALTEEMIMLEIEKHRGTQFHPTVVDAYLKIKRGKK